MYAARMPKDSRGYPVEGGPRLRGLAVAATAAVLCTIVAGGYMAGTQNYGRADYQLGDGAHHACGKEFPTCNGDFMPFGQAELVDVHLTHRAFMYLASLLVIALVALALRRGVLERHAWSLAALLAVQVLVGALNVWLDEYELLILLHLALGWTMALFVHRLAGAHRCVDPHHDQHVSSDLASPPSGCRGVEDHAASVPAEPSPCIAAGQAGVDVGGTAYPDRMRVGIPKEVKNHEYRVAITPSGVHELARHGHEVVIEQGAGLGSSITDADYVSAGATILESADDVWGDAELVLKVKEPIAAEYDRMREGQTLFTYLHLAADKALTEELVQRKVTAVAYETVELPDRSLPLLAPMSEVAGRLAPQVGAHTLMRAQGGRGVLMGGVSGVYAAKVVVIGAGVSGMNAAAIALGMQAEVLLLDRNITRLRQADAIYQGHCQTVASNAYEVERAVMDADMVIGAVLVPGAKAPTLVTNEQVSRMKPGSVLVDISIDQGGCFEDSRPTTHDDPTYPVHNSVFYCVANMPGAVPHTSTYALTNVTLPYAVELANLGWREALKADPALALGLNTHGGHVTYGPVAEAHGLSAMPLADVLA